MIRPDASAIVTFVKHPKRFGNFAVMNHPRHAVGIYRLILYAKLSIAGFGDERNPLPATPKLGDVGLYRTVLVNLFPEPQELLFGKLDKLGVVS